MLFSKCSINSYIFFAFQTNVDSKNSDTNAELNPWIVFEYSEAVPFSNTKNDINKKIDKTR